VHRDENDPRAFREKTLRTACTRAARYFRAVLRIRCGKPAALRLVVPLALLVMAAIVVCTGLGYMLARQADSYLEATHRRALARAVEAPLTWQPLSQLQVGL
jgi:hypothetical protein